MFKAFGASPTTINFNEVYTALQTKVVDGQENPLSLIDTAKLYEVQKYVAITNHMWDGFWFLANKKAFEAMPANLREDRRGRVQRLGRRRARRPRQDEQHRGRRRSRARACSSSTPMPPPSAPR